MSVIVVSGTDTDVGKTIATAAIAASAGERGSSVVVYKPTQTGVACDEPGDVAVVERLTGVRGEDGARLGAAMAPRPAAALEAAALPSLEEHVGRVRQLETSYDLVLVEGAGGLLVELTDAGETIADLAHELAAPVVVVARSALGTLNHTALTLEALEHRGVHPLGVLIGSWPLTPSVVEISNREALDAGAVPLLGAIPAGAGALSRDEFVAAAESWLPGLPR
ncbi:dethiobiotin synthase [Flexivirga oryzae]|uniref:ATP-dependent dethiobiotin synthetase BioD n=1 Tax=Flexivirga oryzae TaxID=1794944 RepID=A0A839N7U3_9MICO|nr:dethiobiotin synthase [Flexivirga oryzae]MBB2890732.1 8-amino-7-oxononanoate synthase/dethiobiotin synthetase [Flexivirga oryzae]